MLDVVVYGGAVGVFRIYIFIYLRRGFDRSIDMIKKHQNRMNTFLTPSSLLLNC